ncbi:equilibrative nucleobase transporter 1-like [Antedon mediterranea]|uniref:equilibrative nucleobase transporter 1-like n=1 Tax=Antedon mediterranea TaxID=105859 RepID=UPI003AF49586
MLNLSARVRKKVTLFCSLGECLVFGGPTFGWASLVYVLRDRGYFSELCANETVNLTDFNQDDEYYPTCAEQDALLQLVFIIGAFGVNSSSLFFGPVYDKYGSRLTRLIGSLFILSACLLFAFSSQSTAYLIFPALHLLASGGILILITSFQVGNLFGNYRSTVVTLHSGAFGSSAIIMLFIKIVYSAGVSMMSCFLFLGGVALIFSLNTFLLLPKYKIPWPLPDNWGTPVKASGHIQMEEQPVLEPINIDPLTSCNTVNTISWQDIEYPTLISCFKSVMFVLFLSWFAILQLVHLFYIGTFNPRFQLLTGDDQDSISMYTTSFTTIQATGVLFAPLCGLVIDRNKKKLTKERRGSENRTSLDDLQDCILAIVVTNLITAAFSIGMMIPILQVQFVTFFLQVMGRAFLYGILAAFVATTFPGRYFGSVYGVNSIVAACVALLQFPLFKLVQKYFDNNALFVDLFLLILNLCTLSQPLYVYYFVSKRKHAAMVTEDQATFFESEEDSRVKEI